jgi:hypothetical protein
MRPGSPCAPVAYSGSAKPVANVRFVNRAWSARSGDAPAAQAAPSAQKQASASSDLNAGTIAGQRR